MRLARTKTTIFVATALLFTTVAHAEPPQRSGGKGAGGEGAGHRLSRSALFGSLDSDQDGELSATEIAAATESLKSLDQDGDGAITVQELMEKRREQANERFQALDQNGDGALSADEIPERLQRMIERFDEDADGALGADELESMKQKIRERFQRPEGQDQAQRPGRLERGPEGAKRRGRGRRRPDWKPAPQNGPGNESAVSSDALEV